MYHREEKRKLWNASKMICMDERKSIWGGKGERQRWIMGTGRSHGRTGEVDGYRDG